MQQSNEIALNEIALNEVELKGMDKVKQYTGSVCEQIRWKKAHNIISEEIENHIIDQKDAFINEGFDEIAATDRAIEEMGDPVTVGSQLDRTHRPKIEWSMIGLTILLLLIGLVINFFVKSASPYLSELHFFYNTIEITLIGIVCMILAYSIDFTIIGKYPKIIFTLLILLVLVFFSFSLVVNGAKRWIVLFNISFSISDCMLLFPTAFAGIVYSMRNKGYIGILLCGLFYAVPAFIFLSVGRSTTGTLLYTLTCLTLLGSSIYKGWFNVRRPHGMLIVFIPTVIIFITSLFLIGFGTMRFHYLLNPYSDPSGMGYVTIVTRDCLNGAKFFGQGTLPIHYSGGASSFLPSMNTDFLLTYLIHRVGWIAFIAVLAAVIAFIARGFYLCSKQKSVLGYLVSTSVLLTFTLQTIIYISANLGFRLFSQITLPLISYGGTATIIILSLIGIMLSVFKSGYTVHDKQKLLCSNNKFLEFVDGKIIIDLGLK